MRLLFFLVCCLTFPFHATTREILIDTDVGVDDTMAIYLAAKSPGVIITGLTCVFGNVSVEQAAENCGIILDEAQYPDNVAIFKGSRGPLMDYENPIPGWPGHGSNGLGDAVFSPSFREITRNVHAAEGIISLSKESDGLSILAIGPLTNLALAVRIDPKLPERIETIVIMGGTLMGMGNSSLAAEFNFHADPEAARIVLEAFAGKIQLVTWELTVDYGLPWGWYDSIMEKLPSYHIFKKVLATYKENVAASPLFFICDHLAAAVLLHPEIIRKKQELYATVELSGHHGRGAVHFDWYGKSGKEPNITLIQEVDLELYQEILENMLFQ